MRTSIFVAMLMITSIAAGAQGPRQNPTGELIALEHRWVDAIVKSDVVTLDKLLAGTYVDTDEEAARATKSEVLAALRSGDLKFQSITLSDLHVHAYGSAAVVTGTAAQHGAYMAEPVAAKVVFTDTFVRTQTGWVVVASQRTAMH